MSEYQQHVAAVAQFRQQAADRAVRRSAYELEVSAVAAPLGSRWRGASGNVMEEAVLDAVASVFLPFVGDREALSVLLDEMAQALYDAGFGIIDLDRT